MILSVLRLTATGCMLKRWPEWSRVVKNRQGRLLAVVRRAGPRLGGLQTPGKCWSRCWCSPSNCSDPFWWMMNSFLCFQLEAGHQRRGEEEWCGLGWENCCCVLFVIISQQRMPGLLSHTARSHCCSYWRWGLSPLSYQTSNITFHSRAEATLL